MATLTSMGRRTRLQPLPTAPEPAPARVIQHPPDPECWSLARLYANGDTRRLRVLDERTVLVLNRPAG